MDNANYEKFKLHIVTHSHWDREWYFTFEEFRFRLIHLIDHLMDCLEKNKIKYYTLDGQTLPLRDYLERHPENRDRLEKLIRSGRIFIGPWFTQPNVFMSGAEALIRNLEFGAKDIEHYGNGLKFNYMPDQFGFNAQLPQMMKGFGLNVLIGGRGIGKDCDTFFIWEGADGTQVKAIDLPHFYASARAIGSNEETEYYDVLGSKIPFPPLNEKIDRILTERDRCPAPHLLGMNGADHMFPNPLLPETIEKINREYPELEAVQSNFDLYLKDMEASLTRPLKVESGELRNPDENSILPASQSMRMDIKLKNIECEDALVRIAEPTLTVMKTIGQKKLPEADLYGAWELMMENHAHDSLCCANCDPSYREILVRFDRISDITRESLNDMDQHFIRLVQGMPQEAVVVKNPSAFDRSEVISFDVMTYSPYREPHLFVDGKEIPCHVNSVREDGLLRFAPRMGRTNSIDVAIYNVTADVGLIPALGYKTIEVCPGKRMIRPRAGLVKTSRTIENEYVIVTVADDATISVFDKASGQTYSGLNAFVDNGDTGHGFIYTPPQHDTVAVSCGENMQVYIEENSPEKGVLRIVQDFTVPKALSADMHDRTKETSKIGISSKVILRRGVHAVEFETEVLNTALSHRLRVSFPTDCNTDVAFCGQPFDVQERAVDPGPIDNASASESKPYHPMNDFCGISDGVRGAVVAGGLTEYEVLPMRNALTLTLIRATYRLYSGVMGYGSKFRLESAQMQGTTNFKYSFIPYQGGFENVMRRIECYRHPLVTVQKDFLEESCIPGYVAPKPIMPAAAGFLRLDGDVVLSSLRPSPSDASCVSLRFYNPLNSSSAVTLKVDDYYALEQVQAVRLDETEPDSRDFGLEHNGNIVTLTAGAKQIVTLQMKIVIR